MIKRTIMMNLKDFGITRETGLLKSGSRLTVFKRPPFPIYLRLAFLSGGRFDPVGKEGLAHFMEHMVVAGTKRFPTKDKLAEYIENYGGEFGANTGNEVMAINLEVAEKNDFWVAIEIANEMLNESLFKEKTVETERGSIHKEIDDWKSNPSRYVWELWRRAFFQKTDMGRPILGSHKTLDKITSNDLESFAAKKLTSSNLSIIISGDITFDQAKEALEKDLRINKTKRKGSAKELPIRRKHSILISRNSEKQVHYILGFRTVSQFDSDFEVLSIISTILGRGRASILSKKLRYEKGLVYTVGTKNYGLSDAGTFIIKTSTSKKSLNETFDIIFKEIRQIKSDGFSQKKIDFAKNMIAKSIKRTMQTSSSWVDFHTLGELISPDSYLKLDDYVNKIKQIGNSEIITVANKYFKEDEWFLAAAGSIEESDIDINF